MLSNFMLWNSFQVIIHFAIVTTSADRRASAKDDITLKILLLFSLLTDERILKEIVLHPLMHSYEKELLAKHRLHLLKIVDYTMSKHVYRESKSKDKRKNTTMQE